MDADRALMAQIKGIGFHAVTSKLKRKEIQQSVSESHRKPSIGSIEGRDEADTYIDTRLVSSVACSLAPTCFGQPHTRRHRGLA
jgi:hypothetical protein